MYCRYCGKKTENTDGVCNDCRNGADGIVGGAAYDKSYGYKDALLFALLSVVVSITILYAFSMYNI